MSKTPKVSILCLTYNQEKYLRQTLDSFMMQKTDFEFEVLINDDASTDGTVNILKEYEKKYKGIIKLQLQKENLYSKGQRNFIARFLLPKAKGQYIAICEGDDYWIDSGKLQIQADFMDQHSDYAICFHSVKVFFENREQKDFIFPDVKDEAWYTKKELLKTNYIPTNAVMYRRQKYEEMPADIAPADWYLHLYHARFGKIKFMDKPMSVYRKHAGGIWWNYDRDIDQIWLKHGIAHIAMQHALLKLFKGDPESVEIILENIDRLVGIFIEIDKKYGETLIQKLLAEFPEHGERFLLSKNHAIIDQEAEIRKLWAAINKQSEILKHKENTIESTNQEIQSIKSSRAWSLRNKIARLMGRPVI